MDIQQQLDRLVDGELSDTEQARLLRQLDVEPEGWRRLALAFVEAQRWGRELRALVPEPHVATEESRPTRAVAVRRPAFRRPAVWTAAAALAVAFLLGWAVGGMRADMVGDRQIAQPSDERRPDVSPNDPQVPEGDQPDSQDRETVVVTFVEPGSDALQRMEVPVFDASELAATWIGSESPAIPEVVEEALRRTGHTVSQQRTLYPVGGSDGEPLYVPVDEIQVHYTGRPAYQ